MKEKLVTLKKDSWHVKLIDYCFDIDATSFNNFCPYFWLLMLSIMFVPFISSFRVIINGLNNLDDWCSKFKKEKNKKKYIKFIKGIDKGTVYNIIYNKYFSIPNGLWCLWVDYYDSMNNSNSTYLSEEKLLPFFIKDLKKYHKVNYKFKQKYSGIKPEYKKSSDKEKANLILSKYSILIKLGIGIYNVLVFLSLNLVIFFISLTISSLGYVVISLAYESTNDFIGIVIFIISVFIAGVLFSMYLDKTIKIRKKHWGYGYDLTLVDKIIYYTSITYLFYSLGDTFNVFLTNLKLTYNDYCPGIDWNKNEKK